ncbi:MAG: hypothetical protein ACFFDR_12215 [Candidatus Thorarchaeota archaeon]
MDCDRPTETIRYIYSNNPESVGGPEFTSRPNLSCTSMAKMWWYIFTGIYLIILSIFMLVGITYT